jgi:imidazolonepropionase-like amidohydrolase
VLSPTSDPRRAQLSPEELEVMVAEASAAGIFVMAHAQAAEGIKNALRAGVRSIEHGIYLDDEAIELLLERRAWLVPTLVAARGVLDAAEAGVKLPAAFVDKALSVVEAHQLSFRRAVEAGVRIAMGTDSGVTPHGQNLRELALMVEGGMTPAAALEATTRSAAQLMGLEADLGTIEPGRIADLVVIDGDPYELTTLPQRIRGVWKGGVQVAGAA